MFYTQPHHPLPPFPPFHPPPQSVGAAWATFDEIRGGLPLRGAEPLVWATYLANGGAVHPLSMLTKEGAVPEGVALPGR
jgi:hypothetical protein